MSKLIVRLSIMSFSTVPRRSLMAISFHRFAAFITIVMLLGMFASSDIYASDDALKLYVNVGDTTISRDADSVVISVFMENFEDSIGGMELWLYINQDEILRFRADSVWQSDTTFENCTDSICTAWIGDSCIAWEYDPSTCADTIVEEGWVQKGATDLSGTMIENWDFVTSNVLDQNRRSLKIVGIANQSSGESKAIPPNSGNALLVKLVAEVREDHLDSMGMVPDSLCPDSIAGDLGVTSILVWDYVSRFSDPNNSLIGWVWEYLCIDSVCIDYDSVGDSCITWECIDWDETDSSGHVDTNQVKMFDGQVLLDCATCDWVGGDADGSGYIDIDDVVYIINYIFGGGPDPIPDVLAGDADCTGYIDIDDVVYLINYIFGGGPAPCPCDEIPDFP